MPQHKIHPVTSIRIEEWRYNRVVLCDEIKFPGHELIDPLRVFQHCGPDILNDMRWPSEHTICLAETPHKMTQYLTRPSLSIIGQTSFFDPHPPERMIDRINRLILSNSNPILTLWEVTLMKVCFTSISPEARGLRIKPDGFQGLLNRAKQAYVLR